MLNWEFIYYPVRPDKYYYNIIIYEIFSNSVNLVLVDVFSVLVIFLFSYFYTLLLLWTELNILTLNGRLILRVLSFYIFTFCYCLVLKLILLTCTRLLLFGAF